MSDLQKLYDAIDGRLRGKWDYTEYGRLVRDDSGTLICIETRKGSGEFIALMGSCADELAELIKAADRLTDNIAEFDTVTDGCFVERLDDAIAKLAAKVKECEK